MRIDIKEIEKINKVALKKLDTVEIIRGRKSENEEFLLAVKQVIIKAISKGIPLTQITKIVNEMYSVKLSVNVIKQFAIKHCGYVIKQRTRATTAKTKEQLEDMETKENATVA